MNDKVSILQLSYGNYVSADDYFKLQSNWNSLREWLKEDLKQVYRDCGYRNNIMKEVLDKMNKLEGKDKN